MKIHYRLALAAVLIGTMPLAAQLGPGPFASFPTADITDGRMLSFGCSGISTFEQILSLGLAVPPEASTFTLSFFDGDTGKADGGGKTHWDSGSRQLLYSLYLDPQGEGNTSSADLVGRWTGNDPNPLSNPDPDPDKQWTASAAEMPDNAWWGVTITTSGRAAAPSGNHFYHLEISTDGPCGGSETLASDFKLAASDPLSFRLPQFGFEASLRSAVNTGPIIYSPFDPRNILSSATTYDGTFEFHLNLPHDAVELRLFDGDFDYGTNPSYETSIPAGALIGYCADEDDLDTPADYFGFPFAAGAANSEGNLSPYGAPADDSAGDVLRRGEPGDPDRMGCVRYEVIDPQGRVYRNDNPSGNLEWEQFRIAAQLAPDANNADYGPDVAADGVSFVTSDMLPGGIWTVRVVGLDLSNLNFWYFDAAACSVRSGVASCPPPLYLLGDTVWADTSGDGDFDAGEPGIAGVTVELIGDPALPPIATAVTGDTSAPNWDDCVRNNTGNDTAGLYCFGVDLPGTYTVRVAAENYLPGGALDGYTLSSGADVLTSSLVGDNVLSYDFGYTIPCGACDGKITEMTLKYIGSETDPLIQVWQNKPDTVVFSGVVGYGEAFYFAGVGKHGTLGTNVEIYVNGVLTQAIHTSCSPPVPQPGLVLGDFEVIGAASRNGGPTCPVGS